MTTTLNELQSTDRLVRWLVRAGLFPAVAAALVSGVAYVEYFAHLGPILSRVLALAIAVAIGGGYVACCHLLLHGAARLEAPARATITPVVTLIWVIVSLASAFPILINAGKGLASEAAANGFFAEAETASDQVKSAVRAAAQIGPVLGTEAKRLDAQATMEGAGVYSGATSEGPVARWLSSFAERFREAERLIGEASNSSESYVRDIDTTLDRARKSMLDRDASLATRRTAQRKAGDDLRTALVGLRESMPLPALEALVQSLTSPQSPAFSTNPNIRRLQEEAVRRMTGELMRISRNLKDRIEALSDAMKVKIPTYAIPSDAELVVGYWYTVPHVAAMAFGLDALPFAIYLIVARLYDAERAAAAARGNRSPSHSPLGAHPHPTAANARSSGNRRNGQFADETS